MFGRKKGFETHHADVNVVPFIDLLSVCISFLLLTAVWVQTGVLPTKQGLGTEAQSKSENNQSLWVELESPASVLVSTQGLKNNSQKRRISMADLQKFASGLKKTNPSMTTALVLPNVKSEYNQLIRAMDLLRKADYRDIGIAPL